MLKWADEKNISFLIFSASWRFFQSESFKDNMSQPLFVHYSI